MSRISKLGPKTRVEEDHQFTLMRMHSKYVQKGGNKNTRGSSNYFSQQLHYFS